MAGVYANGTTSAQTTAFGAQFAGRALMLRYTIEGLGSFHRSATFLNRRFAVTSAHVVEGLLVYNPMFELFDGTNYISNIGSGVRVSKVTIHPDYVSGSNAVPDVALLEFANPFQPNADQIIGSAAPGERVLSAGFGYWGTAATGLLRDGSLRGWDGFVSTSSYGFQPGYY